VVGRFWYGVGRGLVGGGVIGVIGSRVAAKVINRLLGRGWELRILREVVR